MKEVKIYLIHGERIWPNMDFTEWVKRLRDNPEMIIPVTNWKIIDVMDFDEQTEVYLIPSDGYGVGK